MSAESSYNAEDGETICEALAEGHSLLSICEAMGIPHSTARNWERDIPEHGANSARARELGCHVLAEQCLQIADTPLTGEETTTKADGGVETRTGDMLGHRKLQIETRMRLIGKWAPRIYGDKLQTEHSGGIAVKKAAADHTDEELAAIIAGGKP